jgi:hypothetical protein
MPDLRYPIGQPSMGPAPSAEQRAVWIDQMAEAPARLREAVAGLTDAQLATPYRPEGWTVRQLVHHVADSHMNGYVRLKLALTEDEPTVKTYDQECWVTLGDISVVPVEISLQLLEALHVRWVAAWRSLSAEQFGRRFRNPELGLVTLGTHLGIYAWHGRHHAAHITELRRRNGW